MDIETIFMINEEDLNDWIPYTCQHVLEYIITTT